MNANAISGSCLEYDVIPSKPGSNKACRWENFLKKNKICCMLIREFRVLAEDWYYKPKYWRFEILEILRSIKF